MSPQSLFFAYLSALCLAVSLPSWVFAQPPPSPSSKPTFPTQVPSAKPTSQPESPTSLPIDPLEDGMKMIETFLYLVLMKHGRDPDNPWLLAHTLLAIGPSLQLRDGQKAVDRIVTGFLQFKTVGGKSIPFFPQGDEVRRIEPHPFMHIKTFLEIGVPLDTRWTVQGRSVSLQDLVSALVDLFPATLVDRPLGEHAWAFSTLYDRLPKGQWIWKNAAGESVHFLRHLWNLFHYLDRQTSFLRVLKDRGTKVIQKQRQFIYADACGGFHLLQAVFRWISHPLIRPRLQALLQAQFELIFYRFEAEMNLYVQLLKQYEKNPSYRFIILLQQTKFLGHLLETLAFAHRWGVFQPDRAQVQSIRNALRILFLSIFSLRELRFFEKIEDLKKVNLQFYLDLLGDSAHAFRALRLIRQAPLLYRLPPRPKKP